MTIKRIPYYVKMLLMGLLPSAGCAQPADFDAMVKGLIDGDVNLVYPDSLPAAQPVFLDAREAEEYAVSHIPGAVWVGYDDFDLARTNTFDKDAKIVVYCSVGYRSERIARKLQKAGFTNVSNLYGGIFHWVNEDNQVVDANGPTKRVHTYNAKWSKWLLKGEKVHD